MIYCLRTYNTCFILIVIHAVTYLLIILFKTGNKGYSNLDWQQHHQHQQHQQHQQHRQYRQYQ